MHFPWFFDPDTPGRLSRCQTVSYRPGRAPNLAALTSVQVVPIWTRAREARDRATHATQRAQERRVTSWAEIPMPSLALRNLLEAQCASVDRLPYELLAVAEPPLSSIYVRQQVRARAAADQAKGRTLPVRGDDPRPTRVRTRTAAHG